MGRQFDPERIPSRQSDRDGRRRVEPRNNIMRWRMAVGGLLRYADEDAVDLSIAFQEVYASDDEG